MHEFNFRHCGIKVKVSVALAKFNHFIFKITRRWLFIGESDLKLQQKTPMIYLIGSDRVLVGKLIFEVFDLHAYSCNLGSGFLVTDYMSLL